MILQQQSGFPCPSLVDIFNCYLLGWPPLFTHSPLLYHPMKRMVYKRESVLGQPLLKLTALVELCRSNKKTLVALTRTSTYISYKLSKGTTHTRPASLPSIEWLLFHYLDGGSEILTDYLPLIWGVGLT